METPAVHSNFPLPSFSLAKISDDGLPPIPGKLVSIGEFAIRYT